MLRNTSTAPPVFFSEMPTEIHHKIKEFLGPKHALIPAHTCRTLFTIYGHDYIWENWLQTQYQQPPLKQLSNDKFTFTTRKIYQLTVQNDKGYFLPEEAYDSITTLLIDKDILTLDYLINQLISLQNNSPCRLPENAIKSMANSLVTQAAFNKEDTTMLLESEVVDFYIKFNQLHVEKLYASSALSLNNIQHLTKIQVDRLKENAIQKLFLKKYLTLKDIDALTSTQFDRLCLDNFKRLFTDKLLSLEDINTLPENQIRKFFDYYIYCAFIAELLSLEDVKNLTTTQIKRFKIDTLRGLFADKLLSLEDLEGLTDTQVKKLCDHANEQLFRNGQLTLVELETNTL